MLPLLFALLACTPDTGTPPGAGSVPPTSVEGLPEERGPNGLKSWILRPGTGATPQNGQEVEVHYTGWLKHNGRLFDSSLNRGKPFRFRLGAGEVIPGWDQGVALMKVGEKRQFELPADLAYGENGAGGVIPPGAALLFDVELIAIR